MKNVIDKKSCTGCMACMNICPKKAIKIEYETDGFAYPKIEQSICINCGLCKKVCPVVHKLSENNRRVQAYACKNKNEIIRLKSSSGGIFTLIAEWILEQKGVVFGVKFNENLEVEHDYIETKEELEIFRGSKYVQSQIGNSYQIVKRFLEQNRKVLFTGTPCQVEGLIKYLGKEYDNLYTQDIICHGVPSPKVWKKFLEYKKEHNGEYPKQIHFRKKGIAGWKDFQVCYQYNKKEENIHHKEEEYMSLFLSNIDLRKSCYECQFKKVKRNSDITLADFWGIDNINSNFNDNKGISAILVHSEKGKEIFENIEDKIEYMKVKIEDIAKFNSCIDKSVQYNVKREKFFEDLKNKNFKDLIDIYITKKKD